MGEPAIGPESKVPTTSVLVVSNSESPRINRRKINYINVYDVTEDELELLESGPKSAIKLNLAITFGTLAFSSATTLLTVDIVNTVVEFAYVALLIVATSIAIVMLSLWNYDRKNLKSVIERIKNRP